MVSLSPCRFLFSPVRENKSILVPRTQRFISRVPIPPYLSVYTSVCNLCFLQVAISRLSWDGGALSNFDFCMLCFSYEANCSYCQFDDVDIWFLYDCCNSFGNSLSTHVCRVTIWGRCTWRCTPLVSSAEAYLPVTNSALRQIRYTPICI